MCIPVRSCFNFSSVSGYENREVFSNLKLFKNSYANWDDSLLMAEEFKEVLE